jgi:hypothetical protein
MVSEISIESHQCNSMAAKYVACAQLKMKSIMKAGGERKYLKYLSWQSISAYENIKRKQYQLIQLKSVMAK